MTVDYEKWAQEYEDNITKLTVVKEKLQYEYKALTEKGGENLTLKMRIAHYSYLIMEAKASLATLRERMKRYKED